MNISVIIPNYNGAILLQENLPKVLESVKDYKKGKVELIISDDASSDNSMQVIHDFIDSIKIANITGKTVTHTNRKNGGFSKNVTRGIHVATGDILIFLNSDVAPHKDFLNPLIEHFTDEKVFAVGCMDESIENGKVVLRGRGVGKWQRGFLTHRLGEIDKTNTLWVSGGSGAFRSSIYKKIGGLNEIYNPFYWEDIDLSYRAQKAGYTVYFEPKSRVVHEHSKGSIATHFKQFNVQKTVYRNMFFFVWINITDLQFLLAHILWLPYYFLRTLLNKDFAFWAGFGWAFVSLPSVLKERAHAKELFVLSDKEVLQQFI